MKQQILGAALCIAAANARTSHTNTPLNLAQLQAMAEAKDEFTEFLQYMDQLLLGAGSEAIDLTTEAANYIYDSTIDFGEDVLTWTGGAIEDIGEGFEELGEAYVDLGTEIGDWFYVAGGDVAEWFYVAGDNVIDWSEGAVYDTADWFEGAGVDIAGWTVDLNEDFGVSMNTLIEDMEEWGPVIQEDLETMYNTVEDWSLNRVADLGISGEGVSFKIREMDQLF